MEEDVLKDICTSNGINFNKLTEGTKCDIYTIEMFFSGVPKIIGLHHFSKLTCLRLVSQLLDKMEGLSYLTNLRELWIAECAVSKIEGLKHCLFLQKLYLYSNKIDKIENLSCVTQLQVLWLNDNTISTVENLDNLTKLTELNLSNNRICKLGNALDNFKMLESLNISTNEISSFHEITNLMRLPKLKDLSFFDPLYACNPVCHLANYTTQVLYHLPNLERFDGLNISSTSLQDIAEATVLKKKMYYNMRVKTILRILSDLRRQLNDEKRKLLIAPCKQLRRLHHALKNVQQQMCRTKGFRYILFDDQSEMVDGNKEEFEELRRKFEDLKGLAARFEKKLSRYDDYYSESLERIQQVSQQSITWLVTELESGGNVRFEYSHSKDPWFESCHDLVMSRFCATDYKDHNIIGMKIHRIIRIQNRNVKGRFDDNLSQILEDGLFGLYIKGTDLKKYIEYLFFVSDPSLPTNLSDINTIINDGFQPGLCYRELTNKCAIPFTNSITLADKARVSYTLESVKKPIPGVCPFRYGQLLVCKVFLGRTSPALDIKKLDRAFYPRTDSVFRPRANSTAGAGTPLGDGGARTESSPASDDRPCECSSRQCEWFVFDNQMAVPEYVVDFEYITKWKPINPFSVSGDKVVCVDATLTESLTLKDADVADVESSFLPSAGLESLTEQIVMDVAATSNLEAVTYLNLHGNKLTRVKQLPTMLNLSVLIVSFNDLVKLDELGKIVTLEYLDASFNQLTTMDGIRGLTKLRTLNVSHNELCNSREDVAIIRKHAPNVVVLDLSSNPWNKAEAIRIRVIGRMKSLKILNGAAVTEAEFEEAIVAASGARVSQHMLLSCGRVDSVKPRSLSLATAAEIIDRNSTNVPQKLNNLDTTWLARITSLTVNGQHLSKLSNLERLENLRWASFDDNDITKIEGLDACAKLEELSLQKNCIQKIEGLTKLVKLRRLHLSNNVISSLETAGFELLKNLHYLSLESNSIVSLQPLNFITGLIELYIGNNKIKDLRQIYYLKQLAFLVILDLCGNALVAEENCRLFIIYHLKGLKALDGTGILGSEISSAKDTFGGKMTLDYVAEHLPHSSFAHVTQLDFPNANIKQVVLGNGLQFQALTSVNLEHNNLTSLSGLTCIPSLRVLCLNYNKIDSLLDRRHVNARPLVGHLGSTVLENLEVLHLGYNGIVQLQNLQLGRLPNLRSLFLQGNEIADVTGFDGLHNLHELVLDKNKIKTFGDDSLTPLKNLVELHVEENRLRDLCNIYQLEKLERLYVGQNRIQDMTELERLEYLPRLCELSVVNNAVSRRMQHRPSLVYRIPGLRTIDGVFVTEEERQKADMYFMDQQPAVLPIETLPGVNIRQAMSGSTIKVTSIQLGSQPGSHWPTNGNQAYQYGSSNNQYTGGLNPAVKTLMAFQQGQHYYLGMAKNGHAKGSTDHKNQPALLTDHPTSGNVASKNMNNRLKRY